MTCIFQRKFGQYFEGDFGLLACHFFLFQDVELPLCDSENNDNNSAENSFPVHAIVIDASTFNFIDTQAVSTLLQVRLGDVT